MDVCYFVLWRFNDNVKKIIWSDIIYYNHYFNAFILEIQCKFFSQAPNFGACLTHMLLFVIFCVHQFMSNTTKVNRWGKQQQQQQKTIESYTSGLQLGCRNGRWVQVCTHMHPHLGEQQASSCTNAPFIWMAGTCACHLCKWSCMHMHALTRHSCRTIPLSPPLVHKAGNIGQLRYT